MNNNRSYFFFQNLAFQLKFSEEKESLKQRNAQEDFADFIIRECKNVQL